METESPFARRVRELESHLASATEKVAPGAKCVPTMLIAGLVAPLLIFLVLFFLQPSFVQRKEGTKYARDGKKVFYWTLGLTLAIWFAMYVFTWCKGYDRTAMLCSR